MNSNESIKYRKSGFDFKKYIELQGNAISKRVQKFSKGRMYLEVGGKFLNDAHACRVLPGFMSDAKVSIFKSFEKNMDIIFCVNAQDISHNRQLYNYQQGYIVSTIKQIEEFRKKFRSNIYISINLVDSDNIVYAKEYRDYWAKKDLKAFFRFKIPGYPKSPKVLSLEGYGKDEYIPVSKDLVIVTGAASNSGKMSTCLGQIYLEFIQNIKSGYAKYETFPIWNLPINHPINIAYEAATADIGDYNELDLLHAQEHNIKSVNYNRDIQAFKIIKEFAYKISDETNFMFNYKSPTDMGINMAGFCITNDEICCIAALREIDRRKEWYIQTKDMQAVKRCEHLFAKAEKYCNIKGYNLDLKF